MSRSPTAPFAVSQQNGKDGASISQKRILVAATALFELHGERGTTIRQIAEAAEVNSQLIYYYFGDKSGLFRAALENAATRISELLTRTRRAECSAEQRVLDFVREWVLVTLEEASTIRMLHRAVLEGNEGLAAQIQGHASAHAAQISALIAQGIASGDFRSNLHPRRTVISLVGMVNYLAIAQSIALRSSNLSNGRANRVAMARHTAELFVAGIRR